MLTKEQAIEVYEQKLANEAPSAAADAHAAANAAVVARRYARRRPAAAHSLHRTDTRANTPRPPRPHTGTA